MKNNDISGSGGKGGGGGGQTFKEDENTLQTSQTVKSVYALGEGEIGGLVYGAKSIYVNNVALQNADGTYTLGGKVAWDQRQGLPSQPYMAGFPSASAEYSVGVEVTTTTPRTQTTSATNIDAVRVTIGLPNGLYEQKTDQNALVGGSVQVAIDKKPTASTAWVQDRVVTIDGKTTSPYAESVRIERPTGSGTWDVRMRRVTADNASATLKSNTFWNSYTEIQDVKLEYDNTAYVGVAINAKDLGSQAVPTVSFEVFGLYVKVPSNYDPVTRSYSGVWNGTFKIAYTDNPAWHLYDLLSNPRYGLGYRIGDARIDKYSFYAASVYNDGLVPDGNSGQEPRFTCNVPIQARDDALKICQNIASVMHAQVVWMGGKIALIQDRPTSSTRLLTTSSVIDGLFEYSSATLQDYSTAAQVTWNNPSDNYLQKIELIDASSEAGTWNTTLSNAQQRYGYNVTQVAAYGCTRQGQARRHGRWILDSVLNLTETVKFKMGLAGFDLQVGDVVTVSDAFYAGQQLGGRTATGSTTTTIQLDRPIAIVSGSTISVQLPTGMETQTITSANGTVSSVTVGTAFSAAPGQYTDFIITTSIAPRQFKVSKITMPDQGTVEVEALLYDPNKFSRVETGVSNPAPVFSAPTANNPTSAPTNITFTQSALWIDNSVVRSVHVGWTPPTSGNVVRYIVQYRQAADVWQYKEVTVNYCEVQNVMNGLLEVRVYAINPTGMQSPDLYGSFTVTLAGGTGSALDSPTGEQEANTGSTSQFIGPDVNIKWTNPSTNAGKLISLKDFEVRVINPATTTLLRTEYVSAVTPGSTQTYSYTMAKNLADNNNVPLRSLTIEVRCRDANNLLTAASSATLTNPAPAAPTAITAQAGVGANFLTWQNPTDADYKGTYVWASQTSGFTPSATNLIYNGPTSGFNHTGLGNTQAWYYRIAAYDLFSQAQDGTGLTLSSEISATTLSGVKVNEFRLTGCTWTPNSPSSNYVSWTGGQALQTLGAGTGTSTGINSGSAQWTGGVLYIYYVQGNSTLQTTTTLSNAIADNKMIVATYRGGTYLEQGNGRAYSDGSFIIAGTIGSSQLVTGSAVITQGAQIANAVVGNAQIANASVDTLRLAGNAVTMPVAVELGSSVQITTLNSSPQQVMGLWIDSGGQPIFIEANLNVVGFNLNASADGYTGNILAYLYINGSQVKYCYMSPAADAGGAGPNSRNLLTYYWPTPGTGGQLIEVRMGRWESSIQGGQVYATSPGAYSVNSGNTLIALGLKR